jgi:hypothetical protein
MLGSAMQFSVAILAAKMHLKWRPVSPHTPVYLGELLSEA